MWRYLTWLTSRPCVEGASPKDPPSGRVLWQERRSEIFLVGVDGWVDKLLRGFCGIGGNLGKTVLTLYSGRRRCGGSDWATEKTTKTLEPTYIKVVYV